MIRLRAPHAALLILTLAFAAIAGAWIFEAFGYLPCELCLKQRIPYYFGVPLAALVAYIATRGPRALLTAGFVGLALLFAASAAFGVYHAGVEWGLWPGPRECTGVSALPPAGDLLNALKTIKVMRCDEVAIRILGLSLAGWNAIVSVAIALVAARAAYGSSTESQYR